jgi:excisionase family DNA binding protein
LAYGKRKFVDLLRPNELARRLAVSRAWVYEAARTGRIPSVRIGGADGPLRFVPEDIDRWLAEARAAWSPSATVSARTRTPKLEARGPQASPRRRAGSKSKPVDQQSLL